MLSDVIRAEFEWGNEPTCRIQVGRDVKVREIENDRVRFHVLAQLSSRVTLVSRLSCFISRRIRSSVAIRNEWRLRFRTKFEGCLLRQSIRTFALCSRRRIKAFSMRCKTTLTTSVRRTSSRKSKGTKARKYLCLRGLPFFFSFLLGYLRVRQKEKKYEKIWRTLMRRERWTRETRFAKSNFC